ncbi:MAG: hypothetical protein AB7I24_15640 [Candidatus Nanopelagicales bacterium]
MSGILAAIIAALVGGVVAGGATFGLVSSLTAVPAPSTAEYVVYGTTN